MTADIDPTAARSSGLAPEHPTVAHVSQPSDQPLAGLSRSLTVLFSIACGMAVANVYFAQPLLGSIADSLGMAPGLIGIVVTATQFGYALGLVLIVPLGDLINRKRLVLSQIVLSAIALMVAGMSQAWLALLAAMATVGLMAVVAQVLVAYAATLATPAQRGQAVGTVTSGIVLGILLARFISGVIADFAGWRSVYLGSSAVMLILAAVMWKRIPPAVSVRSTSTYLSLIRSLFGLLLYEPVLRARGLLALLIFAAFSVLWTGMVLPLSAPPLSLSHPHWFVRPGGCCWRAGCQTRRSLGRSRPRPARHRSMPWPADAFMAAHQFRANLTVCLCMRRDRARLRCAGRACHQPKPDLCGAAARPKPNGRRVYVLLLHRQRLGRGGSHPGVCPLGMACRQPARRLDQRGSSDSVVVWRRPPRAVSLDDNA